MALSAHQSAPYFSSVNFAPVMLPDRSTTTTNRCSGTRTTQLIPAAPLGAAPTGVPAGNDIAGTFPTIVSQQATPFCDSCQVSLSGSWLDATQNSLTRPV